MAAGVRTPDALGLGCRFVGHHSIGGLAPPADVSNVVLRLLRYESHAVFGSGISHSFGVLAMRSSRIHSGSRVFLRFRSPANARISGSRIPLVRDDLEMVLIIIGFGFALEARDERRILHGPIRIRLVSPLFARLP
jgi:hypothetical protein